ncbi:MAG: chorismate mutase [bacterium]|nr:chorismate mutase [bacterium]
MPVRGIRGATTADQNNESEILAATESLLSEMITKNKLHPDDIISIFFSVTKDLDAVFPAKVARETLQLEDTPLLCLNEIAVPGSLERCIRVLMHVNTNTDKTKIKHIYINGATVLRPDKAGHL